MKPTSQWLFLGGSFLITVLISLGVICLFRVSDSLWFNFGRLYVSRNLSISSRLSSLLAYSCPYYFLKILCISLVSVVISILSILILFICVFSFFLDVSGLRFVNLVYVFKEPALGFIDILYPFFVVYFVYFCSDLYYFLPSTHFGLCLLFFFKFL